MATTSTSICNLALAEVPYGPIQDIDEDSKPAAECRRVYAQALGELLEASRWTFATRRVALAAAANPRAGVWGCAYAKPADAAVLHRLVAAQPYGGPGYTPLVGQVLASSSPAGLLLDGREASWPYEVDERLIYTDLQQAAAEYTRADPPASSLPPLFVRALALDIASRLVTPLTGDGSKKAQLLALYEHVRARAMAADLNRQPVVLDPMPEALAVR